MYVWGCALVDNATHVSPEDATTVAEIENRVAHLVGIPYNPTDTRLQLTHQGPDSVAWPLLTSSPAAVHHDFNPVIRRSTHSRILVSSAGE